MLTTVNERLSSSTIIARNKSSRIEFLSSQRKFVEIIFIAIKIRIFIIFLRNEYIKPFTNFYCNQKCTNSKVSNFEYLEEYH